MRIVQTLFAILSTAAAGLAIAASSSDPASAPITSAWIWDLVIATLVLLAALGSGALPIAAYRNWHNHWRWAALFPFFVLVVWSLAIVLAKLNDSEAHSLWALELFAWAMLTMIYMVSLMTIKRIFEKADKSIDSIKP